MTLSGKSAWNKKVKQKGVVYFMSKGEEKDYKILFQTFFIEYNYGKEE